MGRLKDCQSGTVPKNRTTAGDHHPRVRDIFSRGGGTFWQAHLETDHRWNRRLYQPEAEIEVDDTRVTRHRPVANIVDNDNGELSWGLNNSVGDSSEAGLRRPRGTRTRTNWMANEQPGSGPNSVNGGGGRANAPNRNQVVNKLTQIRDYIQQTESVMSALAETDSPGCQEQHEKLEGMLADLRDSESKLKNLLVGMDRVDAKIDRLLDQHAQMSQAMNGDGPSEEADLFRRADDSRRKVEALERQRNELVELQQRAHRQLAEAEAERARVLSRAAALNAGGIGSRPIEASLLSFAELRNIERMCDEQQGLNAAEHPDEEQAEGEMSDTETDFQGARDKVAELNAMKAQLAQLQGMMAALQPEDEATEDAVVGRRSQSRDAPEHRIEGMKARLNEVNRLVEMVRASERPEDDENRSSTSRARNSEETTVEGMQQMTRELEEHTAAMRQERDRLIAARNELKKMVPLALRRPSSSADDSELEHSTPLTVNGVSAQRSQENDETGSRSGGRAAAAGNGFSGRVPASRNRQRNAWNQSLPTLLNPTQETPPERRRKETRSTQSSARNSDSGRPQPEHDWHSDVPTSNAMFQTQNQLEESATLCEQMLQDSMGRSDGSTDELTGILYSQQQMLTRTVSQCCKLIWLQQRQINELRNALILHQSAAIDSQPPPDLDEQQASSSRDNLAGNSRTHPQQYNPYTVPMPDPSGSNPYLPYPEGTSPFQNRTYIPPLVRVSRFNGNPPMYPPIRPNDVRLGQIPPGIYVPEDLGPAGALNNQVPPGNRANNYWDNFRSYSRQNLLSTSKSNEDSDAMRRAGSSRSSGNQERTPLSTAIVFPNNQTNSPVIVQPLRQDRALSPRPGPSSPNYVPVPAARYVQQPQQLQNLVGPKNNSGGAVARRGADEGEEVVRRVRNNVGTGAVRNRVAIEPTNEPDPPPSDRVNNLRIRPDNLNNRSDINNGLFSLLRDNVFQEVTSFIRANENRPNFLIQLFRDLQHVTSEPQRQRALISLQEVVGTNNPLEVRNNIRVNENRSNLNRTVNPDERLDHLFDQLRENQNTIRQNIGNAPQEINGGSNLENPNISNIRNLANSPRNNLDQDRMRYMGSSSESNNLAPSSKNRNVRNLRDNFVENLSDYERMNPKNVYFSLYDSIVDDMLRRSADEAFVPPSFDMVQASPDNFEGSMYPPSFDVARSGESRELYERASHSQEFMIENDDSRLEEDSGGARRRVFTAVINEGLREDVPMPLSHWRPPIPTTEAFDNIFQPIRQSYVNLQNNNADLAEADQTRSGDRAESDSNDYMHATSIGAENKPVFSEIDDVELFGSESSEVEVVGVVDVPLESTRSESMEGGSKNLEGVGRKNRDKTEGASPKVMKATFRGLVSVSESADNQEVPVNRPMMDIAGALEHLNFQQGEAGTGNKPEGEFLEVEADWELENGLDQVPTRLEKRDEAGGDPT